MAASSFLSAQPGPGSDGSAIMRSRTSRQSSGMPPSLAASGFARRQASHDRRQQSRRSLASRYSIHSSSPQGASRRLMIRFLRDGCVCRCKNHPTPGYASTMADGRGSSRKETFRCGGKRPARWLSAVVFPEPGGPTRQMTPDRRPGGSDRRRRQAAGIRRSRARARGA